MVPSLAFGEYHAAGFGYQPNPPTAAEIARLGKLFGLSKTSVARCAGQVRAAVAAWPEIAAETGVSGRETAMVQSRLNQS